jgi:hypothetical protein
MIGPVAIIESDADTLTSRVPFDKIKDAFQIGVIDPVRLLTGLVSPRRFAHAVNIYDKRWDLHPYTPHLINLTLWLFAAVQLATQCLPQHSREGIKDYRTGHPHEMRYHAANLSGPAAGLARNRAAQGSSRFIVWIVPIAFVMPDTIAVFLGDIKLTPGKLIITLLVLPAILHLIDGAAKRRRRIMASDLLALATSVWMVAAPTLVSGSEVLVTAGSQALEFLGSYVIGRSFFFGDTSLQEFARALKTTAIVVIAFAALDTFSQRYFINESMAAIFNMPSVRLELGDFPFYRTILGMDFFRAASTFGHPILYGSFCSATTAILLYAERDAMGRSFCIGLCGMGCLLSISSAPLLSFVAVITIYCYDRALRKYSWRWKVISMAFLGIIATLALLSADPLSWLIRNLTLDPQSAYFRLMIWEAALGQIAIYPLTGTGFEPTGNRILDATVDCLWLGESIRYGIPMIVLLFFTVALALVPFRGQARIRANNAVIDRMCTAFSLVLVVFAFVSLTVFFWGAIWLFSILCVGVRVSLKEYCLMMATQRVMAREPVSKRVSPPKLRFRPDGRTS